MPVRLPKTTLVVIVLGVGWAIGLLIGGAHRAHEPVHMEIVFTVPQTPISSAPASPEMPALASRHVASAETPKGVRLNDNPRPQVQQLKP